MIKFHPHFGFNGSMIVNNRSEVRKLNNLKRQVKIELVNYYKASLTVTEYLIKIIKMKKN